MQIVGLHRQSVPDAIEELFVAHDLVVMVKQYDEHVEGSPAQRTPLPVAQQLAYWQSQFEAAEPDMTDWHDRDHFNWVLCVNLVNHATKSQLGRRRPHP